MAETLTPTALTLKDIAREAGVSLATVDRVLHNRPGVRPDTVRRVKAAIERNSFQPHVAAAELARGRARRFAFVMPSGPNPFMQQIEAYLGEMASWLSARRISVEMVATDVFEVSALAASLEALSGDYDGVAVVALDHPSVRAAINDLVDGGTKVVTLVSDVPSSRRHHYVGIDNIAAGRTAGALVGRLVGQRSGKVAIIAGSQGLRDHAERIFGFNQVMAAEFPDLSVLPVLEGRDEDERSEQLLARLFGRYADIVGLYNVGAGTQGVAKALGDKALSDKASGDRASGDVGRDKQVVFVGHDVTALTRRLLLQGVMDAAISQNPGHEARAAVRVLLALARGEPILHEQEKIRIDIVMRDNLP
ncbi:LacI family DNA-binding transcriptional regulator [Bradyrhizobium sp. CCGE-LA001]|uniref:LacI family DNA-binding transcriptional regulator n=1 Tax=Bradyrhizobium sp. CCGE-LA001 TaxID=1223566 RepID=UPI000745D812|nr:LacI family DNA-binding transcriptional regulator [Bradyrhizobium sp. CCGE-LA001]AMA60736.1 LacI family transcriptional regulator [Bradyrhizobium sp. CCGE-LA001]